MNLKVFDMEKQINELKYKLYCLLDPIIFSVDSGLDMSEADTYETEKARIGLCFGTEMPIDFFVQNGMTTVNDKRLKSVTHILNL